MSSNRLGGWVGVILLLAACGGGSGGRSAVTLLGDGAACAIDDQCKSHHCNSGLCCRSGICCLTAATCPSDLNGDPVCTTIGSATDCQGTPQVASCEGYVCASVSVADDSGCQGQARACGSYAEARCAGAVTQGPATCADHCSSPSDCAAGYTCAGTTCVKASGTGEECTGTGQGTCASAALRCQNGVCCAAGATCCTSSSQCGSGLTCDTSTWTCNTTCANGTTDRCANPAGTYCSGNACVAKLAPGTACSAATQCASGACECFDQTCTQKKCRSSWCGKCEYATSDTACVAKLGDDWAQPDPNPADGCSAPTMGCVWGACRKLNGQACSDPSECTARSCVAGKCTNGCEACNMACVHCDVLGQFGACNDDPNCGQ